MRLQGGNCMINKYLLQIKKSVWVYPAFYGVLSFLFALVFAWLDTNTLFELSDYVPTLFLTSVDLAQTILQVIAGSLMTMMTFTFSTTMVVLTTYSSQFSPRTVENFLSDDKTMKALGVFLGGFVYAMTTLLFMRVSLDEKVVVSATIAIVFAIFCLFHFILYIHHVGSYIQTNNLILRLYNSAVTRINDYHKLVDTASFSKTIDMAPYSYVIHLQSKRYGYIQFINHQKLSKIANENKLIIVSEKIIGQFISDKTSLIAIYSNEATKLDEALTNSILDAITIGYEKTELQDFNFSIQKIVEIGLRAISPGVNDPNTANHCLKMIGILLSMLSNLDDGYFILEKDKENEYKAIFEAISFKEEIYFAFYQMVHYGKSDISVMLSILQAIKFAMEKATLNNKKELLNFVEYIWEKLDASLLQGFDKEVLEKSKKEIFALSV